MKLVPPKPTPSEKKFDRAREEAFSNEGAPSPHLASRLAANADDYGDQESAAVAAAVTSMSTDNPASAAEPAAEPDTGTPSPDVSDSSNSL